MTPSRRNPQFVLVTWLAIFLTSVVIGDYVVDLAFEWPEVGHTYATVPEPEEVEDSGEHLLMPSQKVYQGPNLNSFPVSSDADIIVQVHLPCSSNISTLHASYNDFLRHPPPAFLVPLRI
jgi:hypothetical protein